MLLYCILKLHEFSHWAVPEQSLILRAFADYAFTDGAITDLTVSILSPLGPLQIVQRQEKNQWIDLPGDGKDASIVYWYERML